MKAVDLLQPQSETPADPDRKSAAHQYSNPQAIIDYTTTDEEELDLEETDGTVVNGKKPILRSDTKNLTRDSYSTLNGNTLRTEIKLDSNGDSSILTNGGFNDKYNEVKSVENGILRGKPCGDCNSIKDIKLPNGDVHKVVEQTSASFGISNTFNKRPEKLAFSLPDRSDINLKSHSVSNGAKKTDHPLVNGIKTSESCQPLVNGIKREEKTQFVVNGIQRSDEILATVSCIRRSEEIKPLLNGIKGLDVIQPAVNGIRSEENQPLVNDIKASEGIQQVVNGIRRPEEIQPLVNGIKGPDEIQPSVNGIRKSEETQPLVNGSKEPEKIQPVLNGIRRSEDNQPLVNGIKRHEEVKSLVNGTKRSEETQKVANGSGLANDLHEDLLLGSRLMNGGSVDGESPTATWGRAVAEVKEQAFARLQEELQKAHQELRLRDEEVTRLSRIREEVESELEELTASLFQEAHNMVREANVRQAAAERSFKESQMQVEVLTAEVSALKTLVLTSTPSRPNPHLHPQIDPRGGRAKDDASIAGVSLFNRKHRRSPSHFNLKYGRENSPPESPVREQRPPVADPYESKDGWEVDPNVHKEFVAWKQNPKVDKTDPFIARVYSEDINLCLDFMNQELGTKVREAVEEGNIFIEAVSDKSKTIFPKKCALLEAPRQCHYRLKLGDQEQWHCISQICRNRIIAVCDFLNYLRYIERGLVKSSVHDVYWEITRLRKEMVLARLGLALSS